MSKRCQVSPANFRLDPEVGPLRSGISVPVIEADRGPVVGLRGSVIGNAREDPVFFGPPEVDTGPRVKLHALKAVLGVGLKLGLPRSLSLWGQSPHTSGRVGRRHEPLGEMP